MSACFANDSYGWLPDGDQPSSSDQTQQYLKRSYVRGMPAPAFLSTKLTLEASQSPSEAPAARTFTAFGPSHSLHSPPTPADASPLLK
jgi:hypothetical protein